MKALLLISHGSTSAETKREVSALLDDIKAKAEFGFYHYAFLDVEQPSIPKGIDTCAQAKATQIYILLNFLNSGKHVDIDIPQIVNEAQKKYPSIKFYLSKPVGQHKRIPELFLNMIESMKIS